jgi:hypothetical protein
MGFIVRYPQAKTLFRWLMIGFGFMGIGFGLAGYFHALSL